MDKLKLSNRIDIAKHLAKPKETSDPVNNVSIVALGIAEKIKDALKNKKS